RRRGVASAIVTSGGSVGNIVGPPLAATLIVSAGWRSALAIMATGGLVLLLAAAALLARSPEAVGLHPDGLDEAPLASIDDDDRSTAQASRSGPFWLMLAMYSLSFVVLFIPFVHGSAFAVGLGVSRIAAATVISSIGIGGLCGRLLVGWLSDRTDRRQAIVLALGLEVAAFAALASAQGLALLYPAAVAFGFGYGGSVAVFPALVADYFGRTNAGAIVGRMFALAGSTAAIGPYVAALIFDGTGSYRAAFAIAAGCNAAALGLALLLPRPPIRTPTVPSAAVSGSSA
ncbi:MAG: MFS transporter, partial [Actinomycetota bacterium]